VVEEIKIELLVRHAIGRSEINRIIRIGRLLINDDVDRLYVKIDNLNEFWVEFCFTRDILPPFLINRCGVNRWVHLSLHLGPTMACIRRSSVRSECTWHCWTYIHNRNGCNCHFREYKDEREMCIAPVVTYPNLLLDPPLCSRFRPSSLSSLAAMVAGGEKEGGLE
jgi:hypothetical protein